MKRIIDNFTNNEINEIIKNSFSIRDVAINLGYSIGSGRSQSAIKEYIIRNNINISHFRLKPKVEINDNEIFIENSKASRNYIKKIILKENLLEYKCSICGQLPMWNGKDLTLTLDHINGNNIDHRLENLRWVCPNCDRQLPTYGSKNTKNRERINNNISKEDRISNIYKQYNLNSVNNSKEIMDFINEEHMISMDYYKTKISNCLYCEREFVKRTNNQKYCSHECSINFNRLNSNKPSRDILKYEIRNDTFTNIGKKYNLSDNAIRCWCDSYGLPRKLKDIKNISDEDWIAI